MTMLRAVLRRLGWALAIVVGVTLAASAMVALLPGDPARALLGPQASPADVDRARQALGLDAPAHVRTARLVRRLVHLGSSDGDHSSCASAAGVHVDLGRSSTYRKPVAELVAKKLPASVELALAATLVQLLLGAALGAAAALRRGRALDRVVVGATAAMGAAPTFVVGLVLQYALAYRLGWLPVDALGLTTTGHARALVLPALTLGVYGTALFTRLVRTELSAALDEPHVRAVRARGASRLRATLAHAARNALAPILQLAVLDLGALVGGAIVTERIFRWPGLGDLAVVGVQNRDAPVVVGVTLVAATAIVTASLSADVLSFLLDPRLRRDR